MLAEIPIDCFSIINKHLSIRNIESISSLNHEIRCSNMEHVLNTRNANKPWMELVELLKRHWCPERRRRHQDKGLLLTAIAFLTKKNIYVKDVILMQELANDTTIDGIDIRAIKLMDYTDYLGITFSITVGSLLTHILSNDGIHTYCKGYGYILQIYVCRLGSKYVPKCIDGDFYSWGYAWYADRIGNVGEFKNAKNLVV